MQPEITRMPALAGLNSSVPLIHGLTAAAIK